MTDGYQVARSDKPLHEILLGLVDARQWTGLTVAEARAAVSERHHGHISGVLSILHSEGKIARLAEKRDGCKIYVHPDYLGGRRAEAQGRGGPNKAEIRFLQSMEGFLEYWLQQDDSGARFTTDKTKAERNHRLFFAELKSMWEERP